ncbi:uncharacterized protein LOC127746792 isoform X4 [Arachis duranensis]|uniref:Uncharacterized protein LOC127746792 isoform X4 n=1 Tax=Arachis duranensis TaxID=130453 RepID=A0A9C6WPL2_ARADU|nr:uncharacterized protein LOC127746792 isoform X4 [Arachis duranensis]
MNGPIFWGLQGLTQRPITFPRPLWWRRYSCCKPAITLKELPICQSCQPASPCLHTMTTCRSGTQAEGIMESLYALYGKNCVPLFSHSSIPPSQSVTLSKVLMIMIIRWSRRL